nr:hypothetical protein [Tanacetum cinerariifolium]
MEDTMLELVKICQEKELLCIHDDVNDLIESALNSKLLLINLNSQHLDKKEQEIKNVVEQPAEHGNRSIQSLQNFRVVHKKIPKSDFDFEEEIRLIENFLYDNSFPRPPKELNAEIADTIIESIPLPIPVQDEGDIRFLEELLIDDSILSDELSDANFKENPSIPRPPPKPPDVETDAGKEIPIVMNDKDEDVNYSSFIFVIYPKMFLFLLSVESEDTIFDPGLSPVIEAFL